MSHRVRREDRDQDRLLVGNNLDRAWKAWKACKRASGLAEPASTEY